MDKLSKVHNEESKGMPSVVTGGLKSKIEAFIHTHSYYNL